MPQFSDDLFLGNAQTNMGLTKNAISSVITGSVTTTVLTVTALQSGDTLVVGQFVYGAGITAGSYITSFGTGAGSVGTYNLSASSSATGSITITASGNFYLGDPAPMPLGVGPMGRVYIWDVVPVTKATNNVSAAVAYATAGNATLAASAGTTSFIRQDGVSVIQLDCPRAISVTTGTATGSALAGVATATGTTGQISYTSNANVVSGQYVTVTGTAGGSGAIAGYTNPTTYILTAVTATTATLTTTAGGVVTTTAGTISGLTFTLGTAPVTVTVSGYDYYGQAMTQTITSSPAVSTTVNGLKAFYQVSTVAIGGSAGATLAIGTTDILGSPVRVIDAGYVVDPGWANALASDTGTFVAADMTNPATSATGDVRSTYLPSTASNGIRRLVMTLAVPAIGAGPNATRIGALGVNQA